MKKLAITCATAISLVLISTSAFAATSVTGGMKAIVPVVAADNAAGGIQSVNKVSQGTNKYTNKETQGIQYTKETSYLANGSLNAVVQTWVDPVTQNKRADMLTKEDNGTIHPLSQYLEDNGTKWIEVSRDNSGKAVSGKYMELSDQEKMRVDTWASFADVKAEFAQTGWKNEGVIESSGGQKLIKLYGENILPDDRPAPGSKTVTIEYAYIDQTTGLPVKVETYRDVNGVKTFEGSVVYEHKYVNDESLFDTSKIPLKKYSKLQWVDGVEY